MTAEKKTARKPKPIGSDQALEELKSDLQRVQADFVNFRRRIEGERGELMESAKVMVVEELLPLFDNLDRALAHAPAELAGNAWVQGVEQVAKQVTETLANLGVEVFGAVDDHFDPKLHEAIAHEGEGEAIIEVFQKGYRSGERVIRPAMVKVGHLKKEGKS
ncbi:MAG TPA: nucleotide exchange factor GrpE [Candidatus Saccharimonadales bacterium]|nr:nucleotide exchange factor GrpE [Candidatus Saccharimonadales bacterium]